MKNADMPAMPLDSEHHNTRGAIVKDQYSGLTKREMFAMHAMQACRSRNSEYFSWQDLARDAVDIADALLAELERTK